MTAKQARVAVGMATAVALTLIVLGWPGEGDPARASNLANQALVAPALSIAAGIAFIAQRRFFDKDMIDGAVETGAVVLANRYLRNTIEQAALASAAWLAFAAAAPARATVLVPVLAVVFLVARLVFALGYAFAPWARAFGFGLTFYPSVAVLFLAGAAMWR